MKQLITALILSVAALGAFANPPGSGTVNGNGCVENCGNTPTPNVVPQPSVFRNTSVGVGIGVGGNQSQVANGGAGGAGGSASSNATGGNATAVGGDARATSAAVSGGNSQAVNISAPEKLQTVGVAPDMIASPTAPCRIAVGVSGGWMGGALGFGSSMLDEGCHLRETSRHLHNLGHQRAAVLLMCEDKQAAAALKGAGFKCPEKEAEPVAVSTPMFDPK